MTHVAKKLIIPHEYPWPLVSKIVSNKDEMLSGEDYTHYLSVGASALQNVISAIRENGFSLPNSILDIPCGHGRVTRVFRAAFPQAAIHVSDLDEDGVAFCAQHFNASPLKSSPDFNTLNFPQRFDVIWVGSLITHLPEQVTSDFIGFCVRHLTQRGVAVLSSHGPFVAGRIQANVLQGGEGYGTENGAAREMVADYLRDGFGYADYPGMDHSIQHYGVTLASRGWMEEAVKISGGRMLFYRDHAWDNHHDIVAFSRV